MIRDGLWGPPLFFVRRWVVLWLGGVFFGWWFMVGFDSYVPLVNGGGVGGYGLLVIATHPAPAGCPPGVRGGGVWG